MYSTITAAVSESPINALEQKVEKRTTLAKYSERNSVKKKTKQIKILAKRMLRGDCVKMNNLRDDVGIVA